MTQQPIAPHPVAALLTPEMKERVRAKQFSRAHFGIRAEDGRCPLGVAIGTEYGLTLSMDVCRALDIALDAPERRHIRDFMELMDYQSRGANPADVYALLDCLPEPPAPAARDEEGGR